MIVYLLFLGHYNKSYLPLQIVSIVNSRLCTKLVGSGAADNQEELKISSE